MRLTNSYEANLVTMLLLYYVFTAVENKIPNLSNLLEKLTVAQKRVILKREILIMMMINILPLQNLTN